MPNVYLHQNLALHTVYNVRHPKTLHFFLFQLSAVSWFMKTTQPSVAIIAVNYSTTDGGKFIRLQSQDSVIRKPLSYACLCNQTVFPMCNVPSTIITRSSGLPHSGHWSFLQVWAGMECKWSYVSMDSSLFNSYALIELRSRGSRTIQHAHLETELAADLGPERCASAEWAPSPY